MLKIIACDDCRQDREILKYQLKKYFTRCPLSYTLTFYESGHDLKKYYEAYSCDVIFFDVEMPGENGIEIAKEIRQMDRSVIIIFLTSHRKYVFSSFLAEPLQYLVKPLQYSELAEIMKIMEGKIQDNMEQQYVITFNGVTTNIPLQDILYFESQGRIINVYTSRGVHSFYASLNKVEKELKEKNFVRIHQSYLVQMRYIMKVTASAVLLSTKKELPVSRSRKNMIHDRFMEYIGGLVL